LLDPVRTYDNCWIWTGENYIPNGSDKAYCYVKQDMNLKPKEKEEEIEVVDIIIDEEIIDRVKPTKSMNDWDVDY
jgi:hypothetical protein